MGMFDRLRRRAGMRGTDSSGSSGGGRTAQAVNEEHLEEWAAARRGVEGFVEPRTTVSEITLLLVAHDGEWTRRRVPDVRWAHGFCNQLSIPSYDAAVVGVPQRMRDYNHRVSAQKKAEDRKRRGF